MDYIISSDNFKSSEEFLSWFLKTKAVDKKFVFKNVDNIKNLYLFLMYYFDVKDKIQKALWDYNNSLKDNNKFIEEGLEEFLISNDGGKYLRGVLASLGYNIFGKEDDYYLPLSTSLEVFQTSILIHDDIIDKSDKRRGIDTIPVRYRKLYKNAKDVADSMALCIGDLGFYLANQIIVDNYSSSPYLSNLLKYYNEMAIKTCKGEMIDVILPFYEKNIGHLSNLEETINLIYELKTAWYSVVGPFVLGALLGGASYGEVKMLEEALVNLGIAYQIKDDLLGIYGDESVILKSSSDVSEYKQTILYSYCIKTDYKDDLLKYYGKKGYEDKVKIIFDKCGAKDYAIKIMNELFEKSILKISGFDLKDKYKNILLGFSEFLKVRVK